MTTETRPRDRQDGTWREVRHHAYIDRPFGEVCRMLAAEPERIIGHPDGRERLAGLHLRRAGMDLARDVRVVVGRLIIDTDAARLPLHWEDARNPKLFPVLDAALELAPLQDRGGPITRVGLVARYRVPGGRVGAWADGRAGHQVVLESVEGFVNEVIARIEEEVLSSHPHGSPAAPSRPPFWRRVFLPLEGRAEHPGGVAEVRRRLTAEPGVIEVVIDSVAGVAFVDYDATACTLVRLLDIIENDEHKETS